MNELETQCKTCELGHCYREVNEYGEPMFESVYCMLDIPHRMMMNIIRDCSQHVKKEKDEG